MQFSAWQKREGDPGRQKRLAVGYLSGLAILAALLAAGVAFGSAKKVDKEEEVDVKFVAKEEAKPEPPPPPPPPPPPAKAKVAPAPAPPKATAEPIAPPPTAVPTEKPPEADPAQAKPSVKMDETGTAKGSVHGVVGGSGTGKGSGPPGSTGTGEGAPAPKGAVQLPEDATPPKAIAKTMPAYPDEARAQGIEAVVVVKFIVTEQGDVTDARIIKGHPLFDAIVLEAVKTWKFEPANVDGKPIAVFRVVKIPFRIKT